MLVCLVILKLDVNPSICLQLGEICMSNRCFLLGDEERTDSDFRVHIGRREKISVCF